MSDCACGHHHHARSDCGHSGPVGDQVALSGTLECRDAAQLMMLLLHVSGHVTATRAEPGCLHFDIAQSEDPLVWRVDGLFRNVAAVRAHDARTAASAWAAALQGATQDILRVSG